MALQDVFEWTDVLGFGSNPANGFSYQWNELHNILVDDEFPPMYEQRTRNYNISEMSFSGEEGNEYGFSKETCDVVTAFMNKHGVRDMLIIEE